MGERISYQEWVGTRSKAAVAFTAPHWAMHAPEKTINNCIVPDMDGWEVLRNERYARMPKMGIIDEKLYRSLR